jgi:hypothetical protein
MHLGQSSVELSSWLSLSLTLMRVSRLQKRVSRLTYKKGCAGKLALTVYRLLFFFFFFSRHADVVQYGIRADVRFYCRWRSVCISRCKSRQHSLLYDQAVRLDAPWPHSSPSLPNTPAFFYLKPAAGTTTSPSASTVSDGQPLWKSK